MMAIWWTWYLSGATILRCVRQCKVMDETPIKAGVASPGIMKAAYFWPIYGELDEICFKFYPDRMAKNVEHALGLSPQLVGYC